MIGRSPSTGSPPALTSISTLSPTTHWPTRDQSYEPSPTGPNNVSTDKDKRAELAHVHEALRANQYPDWALEIPYQHPTSMPPTARTNPMNMGKQINSHPTLGIPYIAVCLNNWAEFRKSMRYPSTINQLTPSAPNSSIPKTNPTWKPIWDYIPNNMRGQPRPHIHQRNQSATHTTIQGTPESGTSNWSRRTLYDYWTLRLHRRRPSTSDSREQPQWTGTRDTSCPPSTTWSFRPMSGSLRKPQTLSTCFKLLVKFCL